MRIGLPKCRVWNNSGGSLFFYRNSVDFSSGANEPVRGNVAGTADAAGGLFSDYQRGWQCRRHAAVVSASETTSVESADELH